MIVLCALRQCCGCCAVGAPRACDVGGYGIAVRAHGWVVSPGPYLYVVGQDGDEKSVGEL